jgi:O-antigen ligase
MRTVTYWLSLIMIFLIPWEGIAALPGFGSASRLLGLAVAGFWLLSVIISGGFRKITWFHVFVFLFFLWSGLTIFWSSFPNYTMTRITTYARMTGLVMIIWDLYDTQEAIRAGMQAFVLGAFAPVLSIINNFLTGNLHGYNRYSAAGRDTNTTGFIVAFAIPLAIYLIASTVTTKKDRVLKLVNFAYIPAAAFAVALTGTRFAMIMSIPAILYMMFSLTRLKLVWRILIGVIIFGAIIYLSSLVPESTLMRLSTADDEILSGDLNGRIGFWVNGVELWSRQPILGVGSGAFPRAVMPIYGRIRSMHNSFMSVLVETGLIGFTLFLSIVAIALYKIRRLPKFEFIFWLTTLAVWGLGNMVMTWEHTSSTWLLFSLIIGAIHASRQVDDYPQDATYPNKRMTSIPQTNSLATQMVKTDFPSGTSSQ